MIYFDNAATGGFKPYSVTDTAITILKYLSANPGRSGHRLSLKGAEIIEKTRETLCEFFGGFFPERVIFTKNATEALNTLILGTARENGHVITSVYEHNSVLRPLEHLKKTKNVSVTYIPCENVYEEISNSLSDKTYLVILNHVSNVTGGETDLITAKKAIENRKIIFASDVSQSAGHTEINMKNLGLNAICSAGHKAMCGIAGSGFLIFDDSFEISPLTFGGTGTDSFNLNPPAYYPERLESGTLNLPSIASLGEGARYLKNNLRLFSETLFTLTSVIYEELSKIPNVTLYSTPNIYGIISFSISGLTSTEAENILSDEFDIAVRGGAHCAPLAHKKLGTDSGGLVRASLSPQNTLRETYVFIKAVKKLASGVYLN